MKPRLVLFDLDHTLLAGDSDVLWCEHLMARGLLDPAEFGARNADMEARYRAGTVGVAEFAGFYVGTLAGRAPQEWEEERERFMQSRVLPRIAPRAPALVRAHADAGDLLVMTTATNRFLTERTAEHFGIPALIATEPALSGGRFTGALSGVANMREGKVERLGEWLAAQGRALADFHSIAYSDSINDQPLLEAVDEPVAVDPDDRLARLAAGRGWRVISLR